MLTYDKNTAILFLVFNRPEITFKVFGEIKKAAPKKLYIAADGPRTEKERTLCNQVRSITAMIDWDCNVHTFFREENAGCQIAVSHAINWFFSNEEEGIILEDDCLPSTSFFGFCSQLLKYYRTDERIAHIGGINFQQGLLRGNGSYYFSRNTHIWGWAGWKRVWQHYDVSIKSFPEFKEREVINLIPGYAPYSAHWLNEFQKVYEGKMNTWDHQYTYLNITTNRLCINPNVNLVSNIGVGPNATHTMAHPFQNLPLSQMEEIIHPSFVIADTDADIYSQNIEYAISRNKRSFISKIFKKN